MIRGSIACLPPLRWHAAAGRLAPGQILPSSLGGDDTERQKFLAWYGDRVLGAAVGRALLRSRDHDFARAQRCLAVVVSNWFLAAKSGNILPGVAPGDAKLLSERQIGTIVEAAVARVSEEDEDAEGAVADLARWLVDEAAGMPESSNQKGFLLELGGTVEGRRVDGDDHDPLYEAVASIRGLKVRAASGTKRKAEQLASSLLLKKMGIVELDPSSGDSMLEKEDDKEIYF